MRPPMLAFLERFLAGAIGLEQFRATFDRRTRTDWDAFAVKEASGAMFLNALAKHTRHRVTLARQLRAALCAPDLAALSPNLSFPLYGLAPASRLAKVGRELARPTYRALGLHERCRFFSSEALLRALPSLSRWATGPDAIEKLAERATADA